MDDVMIEQALNDSDPEILADLFRILSDAQFHPQAAEVMVNNRLPYDVDTVYGAAHSAFDAGDIDTACHLFSVLVTVSPNTRDYWMGYGICLRCQGHFSAAHDAFLTIVSTHPKDLGPMYHLAELSLAQGNLTQARAWGQKCLLAVTDPHVHPLKPALDDLFAKLRSSFDGMR
ncbi:MAG: hypothetical protein RI946_688 [Pseudomonadota bacterium]|jgi:Flp pilus assembly protein TadD